MPEVRTTEQLIEDIKLLPEIELDELLREVATHLRKNDMEHLIDSAFNPYDQDDEIQDLEESVAELEHKIEDTESELQQLQVKVDLAINKLEELSEEEFGEDWGREAIEETIKLLQ
jgi:uncharacterized protein YlxW (UPF0749 family)